MIGTLLARGQRTVTAALRVMGLSDEECFVNFHRVLQRAVWSGLAVSQTLPYRLVETVGANGTLVIGDDETIERRRGDRIAATGTLRGRDPVRSSRSHFAKASGLRWVTLMLLVPTRTCRGAGVSFAQRVWPCCS